MKVLNNIDEYVEKIHKLLVNKEYKVSEYYIKAIYEPKLRLIYILPFYPDNIIFHCIMRVLEPIWDSRFIYDTYSCRKGKGQHKGMLKSTIYVKKYKYCLKCDISQFYPSLNHRILKESFRWKIKDKDVLELLDLIVDSVSVREKNLDFLKCCKASDKHMMEQKLQTLKEDFPEGDFGVPIGNYPSQWFGNLYMNPLDILIKYHFHAKAYVRYCDDFVVYSNDKKWLHSVAVEIENFCKEKLKLKMSKCRVFPTKCGVDFLGYKAFPSGKILLRKRTAKRVHKQIKALWKELSYGNYEQMLSKVGSRMGYLRYAKSYNFRLQIKIKELERELKRRISMVGYPKNLSTKEDYEYVRTHFPKSDWQKDFESLLPRKEWFFIEETKVNKKEDATHKTEPSDDEGVFYRYELREVSKAAEIGYTVEEVEKILRSE